MGFLKQVLGTFIGGFALWLVTTHFDFITEWAVNQIWKIIMYAVACIIGCLIGWKFFEICSFFAKIFKLIWNFICRIGRWFKNIFTINKIVDRIIKIENELKQQIEQSAKLDKQKEETKIQKGLGTGIDEQGRKTAYGPIGEFIK